MAKSANVTALIVGAGLAFGCSGETAGEAGAGNSGSGGSSAAGGTSGAAGSGNGGSGNGGAGGTTTRVPAQHRAVAEQCDRVRPTGAVPPLISDAGGAGVCQSHADCTAGDNGRCTPARFNWSCTYDQCFQDSDCASADGGNPNSICLCGGTMGMVSAADNNVCLSGGNCRTDSECGKGHCSPTLGSCGNYMGVSAYYCHVPEDECVDDADCKATDGGGFGDPYCAYAPAVGHWKCSSSHCAG